MDEIIDEILTEDNSSIIEEEEIENEIEPLPALSKKMKLVIAKKYEFKEDSETDYMHQSRLRIVRKLNELRKREKGVIGPGDIDILSRMINNKIWYNVSYDSTNESYIEMILKLL
jgi:hypothetical protein